MKICIDIINIKSTLLMITKQIFTFIVFLLVSILSLSNLTVKSTSPIPEFEQFKISFNKMYPSPSQQFYRATVFLSNLIKIKQHNSDPTQTYKLGITPFIDLTEQEFAHIYLKTKRSPIQQFKQFASTQKIQSLNQKISQLDWESRGNVSPVKNQGTCGSCYAFSTAEALQSTYSIYKNLSYTLSPQQIIDCSVWYGNNGCNGGRVDQAYHYVKDHGLSVEKQYPYIGRQQTCKKDSGEFRILYYISSADCNSLYNALQLRPITVGVDSSTWALYREGILSTCGRNINHAVLLVGVSENYWRIKNSWGVNWGQDGYIRIARGNTCGVCENAFYPVL